MKKTVNQIVIWSSGCIVLGYLAEAFGFIWFLFGFLLMITALDSFTLKKTNRSGAILQTDTFRKFRHSLQSEVRAHGTQRKEIH